MNGSQTTNTNTNSKPSEVNSTARSAADAAKLELFRTLFSQASLNESVQASSAFHDDDDYIDDNSAKEKRKRQENKRRASAPSTSK